MVCKINRSQVIQREDIEQIGIYGKQNAYLLHKNGKKSLPFDNADAVSDGKP